ILPAVKVVRVEHLLQASIEALDHAVGLWRSGLGQPVVNAQAFTQLIKLMLTRSLTAVFAKQPVPELLAIVSQQSVDLERHRLAEFFEKRFRRSRRLVA